MVCTYVIIEFKRNMKKIQSDKRKQKKISRLGRKDTRYENKVNCVILW